MASKAGACWVLTILSQLIATGTVGSLTYNAFGELAQRSCNLWIHSESVLFTDATNARSPFHLKASVCRAQPGDSAEYIFGTGCGENERRVLA